MKTAVIGATGKAGQLIAQELKKRGHHVTAIIRNKSNLTANVDDVIEKNVNDLTATDVMPFQAVINAIGFPPEHSDQHVTVGRHLIAIFSEVKTARLLVVGGAGSLYVDKNHSRMLKDMPSFPDIFKPIAEAQSKNLADLRDVKTFDWTFISPAADFRVDGGRTGTYTKASEELTTNKEGNSYISYADFAIAVADEVEQASVLKGRFTVVGEEL